MELQSEFALDAEYQRPAEPRKTAGSLLLGDHQHQRKSYAGFLRLRYRFHALSHGGRRHLREFGKAAPRLIEAHRTGHDLLAVEIEEMRLVEIVDAAANGSAASRCRRADTRDHADAKDGYLQ